MHICDVEKRYVTSNVVILATSPLDENLRGSNWRHLLNKNRNPHCLPIQQLFTPFPGTFMCDNEQERETRGVYSQTTSLWSWLNQPDELPKYINPLYDPTPNVIWPSVAPMSFVIWEELYLRWLVKQNTEEREEQYGNIRAREQQLRAHAQQLRRELFDIASQYYGPKPDDK
ncbi:hypothetical protein HF086_005031 [Spodoptera exigua]|uniref:Myotubularin phosphatase domain-containing protein n=1 Tax=Spodoptera exigua TaxID=7107 RepID=A0A922MKH7_SPOEX|nr:hypothetical protein HF086_005031 [Spodoptera exigua]